MGPATKPTQAISEEGLGLAAWLSEGTGDDDMCPWKSGGSKWEQRFLVSLREDHVIL